MKFITIATLASLLLLGHVMAEDSYQLCGSDNDVVSVDRISHTDVVIGKDACVSVTGTVKEVIQDGSTFTITASLGLLTLYDKTFNICKETKVRCPVTPGHQTMTFCFPVPKDGMAGINIDINAKANSQNGKQLFCIKGQATTKSA